MNLRILKKLSKKAAPLLAKLGDRRDQFRAEAGENYISTRIRARKHWERSPAVGNWLPHDDSAIAIRPKCRAGHRWPVIVLREPSSPWPGTVMVGGMSGYECPEWDEESAWCALVANVSGSFVDCVELGNGEICLISTRRLRTPADILRAARELVAAA